MFTTGALARTNKTFGVVLKVNKTRAATSVELEQKKYSILFYCSLVSLFTILYKNSVLYCSTTQFIELTTFCLLYFYDF